MELQRIQGPKEQHQELEPGIGAIMDVMARTAASAADSVEGTGLAAMARGLLASTLTTRRGMSRKRIPEEMTRSQISADLKVMHHF